MLSPSRKYSRSPLKIFAEILAHAPRRVAALMTSEVVTLRPDERLQQAVDLLGQNHFRHLPVADINGRIAGVVSDRDVLRAKAECDAATTLVADVMTLEPLTVTPDTPLSDAVSMALDYRVNCFPVVDANGKICGILTTTDLMHAFQKLLLGIDQLPESDRSQSSSLTGC
jgi:CBS domain-containing protein